jgi:Spy/CpxP family protein refolding chaperone
MRKDIVALVTIALAVGLAFPTSAQMMGPRGGGMMHGSPGGMIEGGMGPAMPAGPPDHRPHEGPLITIMLQHSQDLGLSTDQQKKLRDLRTAFAKESARKGAEIRVAEIELDALLEQDRWDLAKIEVQVKQIAALQGELRLSRIKTVESGRALLTPEQLEKLKQVGHRMAPIGGGGPMPHGMGMPGPGMHGPGGPPASPHQHQ